MTTLVMLPKESTQNAKNLGDTKETVREKTLVVFNKETEEFSHLITVRWYMGRSASASQVLCSIWIHGGGEHYYAGHGKAGGYGYCKYSASFADALNSAGISIIKDEIHGAGMSAVEQAMRDVAGAIGLGKQPMTIV